MSQRPSFDVAKLSAADRILVGGSLLLFLDSFLNWQRVCGPKLLFPGLKSFCLTANAWGGNGAFAGVLMALLALFMAILGVLMAMNMEMPQDLPLSTIVAGVTAGTVLFGIIKFLFVVGNDVAVGAWIGLVLILIVAYAGWTKMRTERTASPPPGFTT